MTKVAFCPHAEGILISAQSNPLVGQIHGRVDAAVNVLIHLRLAEQTPWKNRHGMDRHSSVDGDQIGRQRQFSSIEFKILQEADRKSTRLNSSHGYISYAVFCLKK